MTIRRIFLTEPARGFSHILAIALLLCLALAASAYFLFHHARTPDGSGPAAPPAKPPPGATGESATAPSLDELPRDILHIESAGRHHRFEVRVADTDARRARGLMFVRRLPKHQGMLFLFGEPQPVSMWMQNTYISLDMLFIATDGRIARIAQRTTPHSLDAIESRAEVSAVLEIAGGECARLGLQVGDFVRHPVFVAR